MFLQKLNIFILECLSIMMFLLICYVFFYNLNYWWTNRKTGISSLPCKIFVIIIGIDFDNLITPPMYAYNSSSSSGLIRLSLFFTWKMAWTYNFDNDCDMALIFSLFVQRCFLWAAYIALAGPSRCHGVEYIALAERFPGSCHWVRIYYRFAARSLHRSMGWRPKIVWLYATRWDKW